MLKRKNCILTKNVPIIFNRDSFCYSKSFLFGLREGSFDKKPNVKSEIKKITTV